MKSETTRQRLDKIISEDREDINEATRAAAVADFERIAKEYFDTDGVTMTLKRLKNGTDVNIAFRASRVKNFTVLK